MYSMTDGIHFIDLTYKNTHGKFYFLVRFFVAKILTKVLLCAILHLSIEVRWIISNLCVNRSRRCCRCERYRRRGEIGRGLCRHNGIIFVVLSLFWRRAICTLSITRNVSVAVLCGCFLCYREGIVLLSDSCGRLIFLLINMYYINGGKYNEKDSIYRCGNSHCYSP